jgi:hypothetical protein
MSKEETMTHASTPASVHDDASIAALVAAKLADKWVPAHPLIGQRVRHMSREWHLAGTEWTVTGHDGTYAELAAPGSSVQYPLRAHVSMLDVIPAPAPVPAGDIRGEMDRLTAAFMAVA